MTTNQLLFSVYRRYNKNCILFISASEFKQLKNNWWDLQWEFALYDKEWGNYMVVFKNEITPARAYSLGKMLFRLSQPIAI